MTSLIKHCGQCDQDLPVDAFAKRGLLHSTGRQTWCKRCMMDYRFRQKYGITAEQYDGFLKAQNDVCAICKRSETSLRHATRRLVVDHDHQCCPGWKSCGQCIRGLICWNCNSALGNFHDDIHVLLNAVQYLLWSSPYLEST